MLLLIAVVSVAVWILYLNKHCHDSYVRDEQKFWAKLMIGIIAFIYLMVACWIITIPTNLQAARIKLEAQHQYIMSFPKVPIANQETSPQIKVNIDVPNQQLARQVIEDTLHYWDKVEEYNKSILFWTQHPNLDLLIWGYPRISTRIRELGLKPISP